MKVVILATGLHLTTDCCGDNTRDRASDGETGSDPQADGKKQNTVLQGGSKVTLND